VRARVVPAAARSPSQRQARHFRGVAAGAVLAALIAVLPLRFAQSAPQTYTGEAPVNSQSDEERTEALKTALANVVIDVTGDPGVLARSDVASAVAKADRYMLQYRYRQNTGATADVNPSKLMLIADFDSAAVDQMLQRLGLAGGRGADIVPDASPTDATVWIGGIHSADAYIRAIGYLAKMNLVRSAHPIEARGDGMLVKLSLATDLKRFLDAVAMERTLGIVNSAPPVDGVDATLALGP
jgi:hypothetical protein